MDGASLVQVTFDTYGHLFDALNDEAERMAAPEAGVPAEQDEDEVAAYLDDGASLAERPRIERPSRLSLLSRNRRTPTPKVNFRHAER